MQRTVFSLLLTLTIMLAVLPAAAAEGEFATVNGTACAAPDAGLKEAAEQTASGVAAAIADLQVPQAPAEGREATPRPSASPEPIEQGPLCVEAETSLENGTATARVASEALSDVVRQALSRAAAGEDPAVTLELDAADAAAVEVCLPTGPLAALAGREQALLTVASRVATVALDSGALSSIVEQAGEELTLTVKPAANLNRSQATSAGQFPVMELTLRSNGRLVSDFGDGSAQVTLPHQLPLGQSPAGVVVWYLDNTGSITPCDTGYNVITDEVTFVARHFSKYVIAYNKALLPSLPQRPPCSLPEDERLKLVTPLTLAGIAVVLVVILSLLVQLILTGRKDNLRR